MTESTPEASRINEIIENTKAHFTDEEPYTVVIKTTNEYITEVQNVEQKPIMISPKMKETLYVGFMSACIGILLNNLIG